MKNKKRVIFCRPPNKPYLSILERAFVAGCNKHNIQVFPSTRSNIRHDVDRVVIVGHSTTDSFRSPIIKVANRYKIPLMFIDTSCFNVKKQRKQQNYDSDDHYVTIGNYKVKGKGHFHIDDITIKDTDRWNLISKNCSLRLQPFYRSIHNKYVVIYGHNFNRLSKAYASVDNQKSELELTLKKAKQIFSSKQVIYKPHPSIKDNKNIEIKDEEIFCSIGWHTNALVHSIINGIPSIYLSSFSFLDKTIASDTVKEQLFYPSEEARQLWLNKLSYCSWNCKEIESGEGLERVMSSL